MKVPIGSAPSGDWNMSASEMRPHIRVSWGNVDLAHRPASSGPLHDRGNEPAQGVGKIRVLRLLLAAVRTRGARGQGRKTTRMTQSCLRCPHLDRDVSRGIWMRNGVSPANCAVLSASHRDRQVRAPGRNSGSPLLRDTCVSAFAQGPIVLRLTRQSRWL